MTKPKPIPKSPEWIAALMNRFNISEEDALTAPDNIFDLLPQLLDPSEEPEISEEAIKYGEKVAERMNEEWAKKYNKS